MSLPDLVLSLADNKQMLGLRYAEWATRAPSLEADIAAAAMGLDDLGHSRVLYGCLEPLGADPRGTERESDAASLRNLLGFGVEFGRIVYDFVIHPGDEILLIEAGRLAGRLFPELTNDDAIGNESVVDECLRDEHLHERGAGVGGAGRGWPHRGVGVADGCGQDRPTEGS